VASSGAAVQASSRETSLHKPDNPLPRATNTPSRSPVTVFTLTARAAVATANGVTVGEGDGRVGEHVAVTDMLLVTVLEMLPELEYVGVTDIVFETVLETVAVTLTVGATVSELLTVAIIVLELLMVLVTVTVTVLVLEIEMDSDAY